MLNIIKNFKIKFDELTIDEIKSGNINNTYKLTALKNGIKTRYILQKINTNVFVEPKQVMDNICAILDHLKNNSLHYIKTIDNKNFFKSNSGEYWRCYNFISGTTSFTQTNNNYLVKQTGSAFGKFIADLVDFDITKLNITLPDFHNTKKRYEKMEKLVNFDDIRFKRIQTEWSFLKSIKKQACRLQLMAEKNLIEKRVTHNDTKCSNVLFDRKTYNAVAVIDLDTVMPGLVAFDFGDGARSISSDVSEESSDYEKVKFNTEKFDCFSKGFIEKTKNVITDTEKTSLYYGLVSITAELAVRFMTDYIERDKYFKISYPENNLVRAKNQIALLKDILKKQYEIKKIINNHIK